MKKFLSTTVLIATVFVGAALAYSIWKATSQTPDGFFESGKQYYEQKKYPEAVIQFLNVRQKEPHHREALRLLARSYLIQQDLPRAVQHLNVLLEFYPDDVPANLELGNIYLTVGRQAPDFFHRA